MQSVSSSSSASRCPLSEPALFPPVRDPLLALLELPHQSDKRRTIYCASPFPFSCRFSKPFRGRPATHARHHVRPCHISRDRIAKQHSPSTSRVRYHRRWRSRLSAPGTNSVSPCEGTLRHLLNPSSNGRCAPKHPVEASFSLRSTPYPLSKHKPTLNRRSSKSFFRGLRNPKMYRRPTAWPARSHHHCKAAYRGAQRSMTNRFPRIFILRCHETKDNFHVSGSSSPSIRCFCP